MSSKQSFHPHLSKRLFLLGLNCHKALYLEKYHKELKGEPPDGQEALFQSGYEVEELALQLFPEGFDIPYHDLSIDGQIVMTTNEIKKGTPVLYHAAFSHENLFVKTDILEKKGDNWDLYEVKSSGQVKEYQFDDVAIQYYVIKGSGVPISKAHVIHVNTKYVRQGKIEPRNLFTIVDCTTEVLERQDFVEKEVAAMREMLSGEMPTIDIGEQCGDACAFHSQCWRHIPEESIFDIIGRNWIDTFAYYRRGIVNLRDLPGDELDDVQRMQVAAYLKNKDFINHDSIRDWLATLWYPLYFLDFETTFLDPIPMFDGTRPYQKIPFQYSLHWLTEKVGPLHHSEYLGEPGADPRRELIDKLLHEIPTDACVLVYNAAFETSILNSLADWFPEHADKIGKVVEHIRDLMIPFKNKDYYNWDLWGSYSLKYVLPALIPQMSYDEMAVQNGEMAKDAYMRMYHSSDPAEIARVRNDLLAYCKLDTLAEVKVLERLRYAVDSARRSVI